MSRHYTMALVAVAFVAMILLPGPAAADITGVTVSPNPAVAGNPVTVTVNGSGACDQIAVDFGDGKMGGSGSTQTWPQTFQHTYLLSYASPLGTKTITAWGYGCLGRASATLTLVAGPGQITGFSLPPQARQGQEVTFQVAGTGYCDQLDLDFGDGKPHATPFGFTFPNEIRHTYDQPGPKTLKATGGGRCQGQATAPLTVAAALQPVPDQPLPASRVDRLCRLTNCSAPSSPHIDGWIRTQVTPGDLIYVRGSGFGTTPGEFRLYLGRSGQGSHVKLIDLDWHDNWVLGTVPPVTGVPDAPAAFTVVRKDGAESNYAPASFIAARQLTTMEPSAVRVVSCSLGASSNRCNGVGNGAQGPSPTTFGANGAHGWHDAGFGAAAAGTDVYAATLKNGWRFYDWDKGFWPLPLGASATWKRSTSGTGLAESTTLEVDWRANVLGYVGYYTVIYIEGPHGVPYQ